MLVKSKFKSEKSKKNKRKNRSFKRKWEKKDIKINTMCVTWPLNICLVILRIRSFEHYILLSIIFLIVFCILYTLVLLCVSMYRLSCIQRFFYKMKLVKTLLHTQLKQTNLENQRHISTESPKRVLMILFLKTLYFQYAKRPATTSSSVFVLFYFCIQYIWSLCYIFECFAINCFALYLFHLNLQYFSPSLQDLFAIFNETLSQLSFRIH